MSYTRAITETITWIGGDDRRISLFENAFPVPLGMSYNSYLLLDAQTVLFDTVDRAVAALFFENLAERLQGRSLDYAVVCHVEPDHAATLTELVRRYPQVKPVSYTHLNHNLLHIRLLFIQKREKFDLVIYKMN